MHPNNWKKGELAQLKVELRAIEKGIIVSKPTCSDCRYDVILDDGKRLLRAQIKYAGGADKRIRGSIIVPLRKTHKTGRGNKVLFYSPEEIDVVLVYVPQLDKVLIITDPKLFGQCAIYIRIEKPLNEQKNGYNWFEDFLW